MLRILAVLAAVLMLAVVWFAIKFRSVLRALVAGGTPTPSRVTLRGCADPNWSRRGRARRDLEAFRLAGFRNVGTFDIPEMPGVQIVALVHAERRTYGVTYRHPAAGVWSDVVVLYDEGRTYTASSAPSAGEVDQPPWADNVYEPGAGAERLIELARTAPQDGRKAVTGSDFEEDFTTAYARAMAWRNERGVTPDEIRRVAEGMDLTLSEEEATAAHETIRSQMMERFRTESLDNLLRVPGLSEVDARHIAEHGAVVVNDRMTPAEVVDELRLVADLGEEALAAIETMTSTAGSPRSVFKALVSRLPDQIRARHVGSVEEPVAADVWIIDG